MIDAELLKLLRCPETRQPLTPAAAGLLVRLNGRIATGELRNRGGQALQEKLPAGLVRQDIPVTLLDEAILLT
ncbi:MAG: hypothetical protein EXS33_01510 [Pedosphaera sp.]|nr:hypothetical protein [Pedosphaera sp.]